MAAPFLIQLDVWGFEVTRPCIISLASLRDQEPLVLAGTLNLTNKVVPRSGAMYGLAAASRQPISLYEKWASTTVILMSMHDCPSKISRTNKEFHVVKCA